MSQPTDPFPLDQNFARSRALSGIDEAGRGCLAGPVVVACVTWKPQVVRRLVWFANLADSKQIDAKTRAGLYPEIVAAAERIRIAVIHPIIIDQLNILQATFHGFELVAPSPAVDVPLVIDGHLRPKSLKWAGTQVKGDALLSPVSAAGVVAKVTRDALMTSLEEQWPGYGFAGHKGYATVLHRKRLTELGACPQHRKSYRPISEICDQEQPADAAFLEQLANTRLDETPALFEVFRSEYHRFSRAATRQAVHLFTHKGLTILPRPADFSAKAAKGLHLVDKAGQRPEVNVETGIWP